MAMNTQDLFDFLESLGAFEKPYVGKIITIPPLGQDEEFNFTLPKGKGTGLWMGLVSWLGNKGYTVVKIEETMDISPVDQGYYALTQRNNDELEGKIKQGLASASQAVADYELIAHDWRKYEGFLKMLKTDDEHSLRATFIDEVDISTGNNAIKTAIARWPTMIVDFMKLGEKMPTQTNVDEISKGLGISKAEAVLLSTKQRLYIDWKDRFGSEVEKRCQRILALKNSREMTINEYRDWLRPIVAKHKMYKESLSGKASETAFSAYSSPGQALSTNNIEIWGWQPMLGIVGRTGTMENVDKDFAIEPYDEFTKKKVIFATKKKKEGKEEKDIPIGLNGAHTWMDENWVKDKVDDFKKKLAEGNFSWMKKDELYYAFLRMNYERVVIKMPDGTEMEDVTFKPKMWFFSQNALLVLLLHYEAIKKEFDDYIDNLIGVSKMNGPDTAKELADIIKKWKGEDKRKEDKKKAFDLDPLKKDLAENWEKINKAFGFNFTLSRNGPYEHDFMDRIATPYLATEAVDFYIPLTQFLMGGAGVGK
jgi:hypothetical protein